MVTQDDEGCKVAIPVSLRVAISECSSAEEVVKQLAPLFGIPEESVSDPALIVFRKFTNPFDFNAVVRWVVSRAAILMKRERKEPVEALRQAWDEARTEYQKKFGRSL